MRVLVTGGAGMIGSHLVDELLENGYEVTVLDNLEPEVHPHGKPDWVPADVRFLHGDVRDGDGLAAALEGCEGVFHLAAYGGFSPEFSRMADVNCTGTARLLEAAARSGAVERVVTASSMAVYGEGWYRCAGHRAFHGEVRDVAAREAGRWEMPCPQCSADCEAHPIPESSEATPWGAYAGSKFFQERLTLSQGRDHGMHAVALRYFLTFGCRQSVYNAYSGICSIFSTRILNGKRPVVYEDGLQSRDIVAAPDVARATRLVFEAPAAAGRVFNVASGRSTRIADFARMLARAYGVEIEPEIPDRFRPMDCRHMLGDTTALAALGWSARVPIEAEIERYAAWIQGQGGVGEAFTRAERRLRELGIVREIRT